MTNFHNLLTLDNKLLQTDVSYVASILGVQEMIKSFEANLFSFFIHVRMKKRLVCLSC